MTHGFNGHAVVMLLRTLGRCPYPLIASYHGEYHAGTRTRRFVEPLFNRLTHHVLRRRVVGALLVDEFSKVFLCRKGVPESRLTVIHNGIPDIAHSFAAGQRLRALWGVPPESFLLGTTSRLDPVKGVEYLLSAVRDLRESHPSLRVVIVGSGPAEQSLRKESIRLGLSSTVVFAGFRSDVSNCLSAFDAFVLPSLMECHSIGLLEAMRAARPIVATTVGGNTESVRHELEALVVPPADAASLAIAIARLLESPKLCEHLRTSARERFLAEFTAEKAARSTAQWLLECHNASRQSAAAGYGATA